MSLSQALSDIDGSAAAPAFRPPAGDDEIQALASVVLAETGLQLPEELEALFRWHDGQAPGEVLVEGQSWRLFSVSHVLKAWHFFLDPESEFLLPYESAWLPLIGNGASDYLLFDLESAEILSYWHDRPDRGVEHVSLEAWALDLAGKLAEAGKPPAVRSALVSNEAR